MMDFFKRTLFLIIITSLSLVVKGQSNAELLSVQLSAKIQKSPTQITIDWVNDGSASGFSVFRRANPTVGWGSAIATLGGTANTYVDNTVLVGIPYEYKVQKNGSTNGYGYINAAIELPEVVNRGILILVVEDTYKGNSGFDKAVEQTIEDIENDGWIVRRIDVNKNDSVPDVKSSILNVYNQNPTLTQGLYLIGHVPVPYSGLMNPDAHPDHLGAWPTDSYYADVNGVWTDANVNDNTSASQSRNHNVPGDGKFDQSTVGANELQVGRLDFFNMPAFSQTEEELLVKYLNKAHQYKIKSYTVGERALVEDNFASFTEGFSSSGLRNFSTMFTSSNVVTNLDYRTTMNNDGYMWSYGCGAGSYTSCSGIGTTTNFASDSLQTVFTMLFGSYFGDWDNTNNLLRAVIGQGLTLNTFWAGRPHWQVHHMALGENIGYSARLTQNNTSSSYFVSTLPYFSKWIHITLLGDPTNRMHYIKPPSNLVVVNNNNDADLSWVASTDTVLGYNVYRLDPNADSYVKVNSALVTGTTFTDNTVAFGGLNTYIVKAVQLKTTASGSYFNQSLGIRDEENFTVGISDLIADDIAIYPNPAKDFLKVEGGEFNSYTIYSVNGQMVSNGFLNDNYIVLRDLNRGFYFLELKDKNGNIYKKKFVVE